MKHFKFMTALLAVAVILLLAGPPASVKAADPAAYTDTGLTAGKSYNYKVISLIKNDNGRCLYTVVVFL